MRVCSLHKRLTQAIRSSGAPVPDFKHCPKRPSLARVSACNFVPVCPGSVPLVFHVCPSFHLSFVPTLTSAPYLPCSRFPSVCVWRGPGTVLRLLPFVCPKTLWGPCLVGPRPQQCSSLPFLFSSLPHLCLWGRWLTSPGSSVRGVIRCVQ